VPLSDAMRRSVEDRGSGRDVILGVRPESFEDAALVPADNQQHGVRFPVDIDVVESMGSDVFAYFELEGGPAESAELEELARDSGRADIGTGTDQVVARLDAATEIAEGESTELWVDTRNLHIFDPASGQNLTQAIDLRDTAGPPPTTETTTTADSGTVTA
jgi:multiple sugar transport system ATP-binding protein